MRLDVTGPTLKVEPVPVSPRCAGARRIVAAMPGTTSETLASWMSVDPVMLTVTAVSRLVVVDRAVPDLGVTVVTRYRRLVTGPVGRREPVGPSPRRR